MAGTWGGGGGQGLTIAPGQRQLGALGPEQPRGGQPDPGIAAQHDHAFIGEAHQNIPLVLAAFSGTG